MIRSLIIAIILSTAAVAQQAPAVPPGELVNAVIANELKDRQQQRKWMYLVEKRDGNQTLIEEQVETRNGPLYRVLTINGTPLSPDQRQQG